MRAYVLVVAICALLGIAAVADSWAGVTERVSVAADGTEANGESLFASVSADGRFVVFSSQASNLVPRDRNDAWDVFLRDRLLGTTEMVDVSPGGKPGDLGAWGAFISADGRYIVFDSESTNLVPGDNNGLPDVFVRDRISGSTEFASFGAGGELGNGSSHSAGISADGRYVVFRSYATNLIPDDTNGVADIFVRDRLTNSTQRVSVSSAGEQADGSSDDWDFPVISGDGRFVAFGSWAHNLVPGVSNPGRHVYVRDRVNQTTECVDLSSEGELINAISTDPKISADGRYVAFASDAPNLVSDDTNGQHDIFVRDRQMGATERVSLGNSGQQATDRPDSTYPSISADGRFVAFSSHTPDFASDDTMVYVDCFVRDRLTGRTQCVSRSTPGDLGDMDADYPSLSVDGRYVVFTSYADDLVEDDGNGMGDIFLRDRLTFPDISLDQWAFYDVEAAANGTVITGDPDGLYHPGDPVTRAQMAVFISRCLAGEDSLVPTGPSVAFFSDVPTDHWAFRYVEYAHANGIVIGYQDGYHPDDVVDRAQVAVFVARAIVEPTGDKGLADYTPPATPSFADVPVTYWAYRHIEYLREQGIVRGYGDGYRPAVSVSRDQMAVYVNRAFDLPM